ncbi:methyl-accepting chemotaxis protein, partial [Bacillus cereus]|uniref:methyl-accepting chemotaxis protein n=1 Tax=Bacillus cereus TaxID=1396 RepID=UPI00123B5D37
MKKVSIIFLCVFCIVSHTIPVFADTPSFQLLGSKGVSIENKGIVGGKYSLVLRVNDAEDVVTFQLSELMLVNDCSFNLGKAKWTRPSQEKNEFEINWEMNGTYAFYIFVNGKVKGYARFKLTGFPKNGEGGGTTQYTGNMAKYYELPPENFDPNDFADYDNKLDGVCTNEKLPEKPHGSGDIEEPKDDNKPPVDGGGGSDKAVKEALEKIVSAVNEISKNTGETAKNTGETAKNTGEIAKNTGDIKKNTDEIAKNTKEIADAVKDIRDNLKIPDDMDLSIKPVLPEDIKPDKPKQPDKPFEDKQEHFKEGEQEKPPDKLPVAPEPAECWGDVCKDKDNQKEEDMKKEKDMDKEEPMKPDKPMEKEDMKPDKPMTPDKPMEKE